MKTKPKWPRPKMPATIYTLGFGERKTQAKIWKKCVDDAIIDKEWADAHKHDREWMSKASDVSLDMMHDLLAKTVEECAKNTYAYRFYRAHLEQGSHVIDPAARRDWTASGGKLEKVK